MSGTFGGTMQGLGSALQGATSLAAYVLGSNTTTNSNTTGSLSSSQHASTTVSDRTDTSSTSETKTSSLSKTEASADAGVIASLKSLAQDAINNSNDPSKTQNLIASVLQQAGDAMTSIFGAQKQSGMYNGASATTQSNNILSRAAAEAATAVLGYQTSEQQIASSALKDLLAATATSTTTGNTDSVTKTNTSVNETASTNVDSSANSSSIQQTTSKSKSGMSVVCTWMKNNDLLSHRRYVVVSVDFLAKNKYKKHGYLTIARPLVRILEADHTTLVSAAILWVFTHRTEYVCAQHSLKTCKKTWKGMLSVGIVAVASTPAGVKLWLQDRFQQASQFPGWAE